MVISGEKPWSIIIEEEKSILKLPELPQVPKDSKKKGRSGVGYTTGTGTVWNVTKYF